MNELERNWTLWARGGYDDESPGPFNWEASAMECMAYEPETWLAFTTLEDEETVVQVDARWEELRVACEYMTPDMERPETVTLRSYGDLREMCADVHSSVWGDWYSEAVDHVPPSLCRDGE